MKRNLIVFILVGLIFSFLFGCKREEVHVVEKKNEETISVNGEKNYEEIKKIVAPTMISNCIDILKANRGYISIEYNGSTYIAILAGQKSTGGYGIKIGTLNKIGKEVNIVVEEKTPGPKDIVTQALTYPYAIIKINDIGLNIWILDSNKIELKNLNKGEEQH